jgi:hypothetical protein
MAKSGPKGPHYKMDWVKVEKMLQAQCTQKEIASILGCTPETLAIHCKNDTGMTWGEFSQLHKGSGRSVLRQAQWDEAIVQRDKALLIFLGKQYLNQKDRREEITKEKPPTEIKVTFQDASSTVPHPSPSGSSEPASLAGQTDRLA